MSLEFQYEEPGHVTNTVNYIGSDIRAQYGQQVRMRQQATAPIVSPHTLLGTRSSPLQLTSSPLSSFSSDVHPVEPVTGRRIPLPTVTGIENYNPLPYCGPEPDCVLDGRVIYQENITTSKPFLGARYKKGRKREFKNPENVAEVIYTNFAPLEPWGDNIYYNERGYWGKGVQFDCDSIKAYFRDNPLGSSLICRLDMVPTGLADRYPEENVAGGLKCRNKNCRFQGKLTRGQVRVSFDELTGRLRTARHDEIDPYFATGYMHLSCLEEMIDLRQLICEGILTLDDRKFFKREPRGPVCWNEVSPLKKNCAIEMEKQLLRYIREPSYKVTPLCLRSGSLYCRIWMFGSNSRTKNYNPDDPPFGFDKEDVLDLQSGTVKEYKNPGWGGDRHYARGTKNLKASVIVGVEQNVKAALREVILKNHGKIPEYLGRGLITKAKGYLQDPNWLNPTPAKATAPQPKKRGRRARNNTGSGSENDEITVWNPYRTREKKGHRVTKEREERWERSNALPQRRSPGAKNLRDSLQRSTCSRSRSPSRSPIGGYRSEYRVRSRPSSRHSSASFGSVLSPIIAPVPQHQPQSLANSKDSYKFDLLQESISEIPNNSTAPSVPGSGQVQDVPIQEFSPKAAHDARLMKPDEQRIQQLQTKGQAQYWSLPEQTQQFSQYQQEPQPPQSQGAKSEEQYIDPGLVQEQFSSPQHVQAQQPHPQPQPFGDSPHKPVPEASVPPIPDNLSDWIVPADIVQRQFSSPQQVQVQQPHPQLQPQPFGGSPHTPVSVAPIPPIPANLSDWIVPADILQREEHWRQELQWKDSPTPWIQPQTPEVQFVPSQRQPHSYSAEALPQTPWRQQLYNYSPLRFQGSSVHGDNNLFTGSGSVFSGPPALRANQLPSATTYPPQMNNDNESSGSLTPRASQFPPAATPYPPQMNYGQLPQEQQQQMSNESASNTSFSNMFPDMTPIHLDQHDMDYKPLFCSKCCMQYEHCFCAGGVPTDVEGDLVTVFAEL